MTPAGELVRSIELEFDPSPHGWAVYQMRDVKHLLNGNFLVAHQQQRLVNEYGPDGKPRPGHDNLLYCPKGTGIYRIPLALNAPLGVWRVIMTDSITNQTAKAQFTVTP